MSVLARYIWRHYLEHTPIQINKNPIYVKVNLLYSNTITTVMITHLTAFSNIR